MEWLIILLALFLTFRLYLAFIRAMSGGKRHHSDSDRSDDR